MNLLYVINPMEKSAATAELKQIVGDVEISSFADEKKFQIIAKAAEVEDYIFLIDEPRKKLNCKAKIKRRLSGETVSGFIQRVCYEEGWGEEELTEEKQNELYEMSVKLINSQGLVTDDAVLESIKDYCLRNYHFSVDSFNKATSYVFNKLRGYGVIEELIENPSYTEIMVNGLEEIMVEEKGCIHGTGLYFKSREDLMNVVRRLALDGGGKSIDEASPLLDAEVIGKDGSRNRINIVLSCIASNGPCITIRKKANHFFSLEDIVCQDDVTLFIDTMVKAGYNIFVSGGTGSGKTTLLNAMAQKVKDNERVIVIEDTPEIAIEGKTDVVYMQTRKANNEGNGEVSCRELIKNSLRMRPDRIAVGEVRGVEVLDMFSAMNTGHDGSLSTGHSNSPKDMITRLETMAISEKDIPIRAIRLQIASALDLIIHVSRMRDGSRRIKEISEVTELDQNGEVKVVPLWIFKQERLGEKEEIIGRLVRTGQQMHNLEKMYAYGLTEDEIIRISGNRGRGSNDENTFGVFKAG